MIVALPDLYLPAIVRSAEFYFGVPAPVPLLVGQMRQESGFDPKAKSKAGAQGLYQFMPATAQWAAKAGGFGLATPFDPEWSIRAAVWYDRHLYDRVAGATPCDKWAFALSSYNGGLGWVYERQTRSDKPLDWTTTAVINPGINPDNQDQNVDYVIAIVWKWQPQYRTYGKTICL
jgi:soluble lytic murein transglycosylase-like protein